MLNLVKNAKKEMATAIADAIIAYFKALDGSSVEEVVVETTAAVVEQVQSVTESVDEGCTIQLISSMHSVDVNDYQFKSYKGKVRELMGTGKYKYKYCYGTYSTSAQAQDALKEVRATFKDAYVVYFKGGDIVTKR